MQSSLPSGSAIVTHWFGPCRPSQSLRGSDREQLVDLLAPFRIAAHLEVEVHAVLDHLPLGHLLEEQPWEGARRVAAGRRGGEGELAVDLHQIGVGDEALVEQTPDHRVVVLQLVAVEGVGVEGRQGVRIRAVDHNLDLHRRRSFSLEARSQTWQVAGEGTR